MEINNNFFKSIGKDKLILISIAGIILILCSYADISKMSTQDTKEVKETEKSTILTDDYISEMEEKLRVLIENVNGAGKCQVMITLKSTNEKILQSDRNTKSKSEKGENVLSESDISSNTLILQGEDEEYPYVIKEVMPEVEGVVVVAKGAGNKKVNADIIKIVQALFNVETHKISIIEMK